MLTRSQSVYLLGADTGVCKWGAFSPVFVDSRNYNLRSVLKALHLIKKKTAPPKTNYCIRPVSIRLSFSYSLLLCGCRYGEAQEAANGVLSLDNLNADAIYVRGLCLYYEDNVDRAFSHFTQVKKSVESIAFLFWYIIIDYF